MSEFAGGPTDHILLTKGQVERIVEEVKDVTRLAHRKRILLDGSVTPEHKGGLRSRLE